MTPYDPQRHHRRSIRLPGYDYTQPGAYFITIVTHERAHWFGRVIDGNMELNPFGEIAREEWFKTAVVRPYVRLDERDFVVMPNHVHGIIWITDDNVGARDVGAQRRCAPTMTMTMPNVVPGSIGAIIRAFKSAAAKRINILRDTPGAPIWQRNYYEHSIRNDDAWRRIAEYIITNPQRWVLDRENPDRAGVDEFDTWFDNQGDAPCRPNEVK